MLRMLTWVAWSRSGRLVLVLSLAVCWLVQSGVGRPAGVLWPPLSVRLVFGYCVPETVTVVEFDSLRPSSVQMAPVALQSVVAGSVMLIAPLPLGLDGDGPGLVAALHLPLGLGDRAVVVLGERVVAQRSVAEREVLAERQVEGELAAAAVAVWHVAEGGGQRDRLGRQRPWWRRWSGTRCCPGRR